MSTSPQCSQRQIDATDRQIDRLVYELYDLTEEEIRIVEGGSRLTGWGRESDMRRDRATATDQRDGGEGMRPNRYRLYVDESGDAGTSKKSLRQDPYLTLVGVALETQYYRAEFQPQLEDFKKRHLPYDPDDPPILHKNDIIHKRGIFKVLRDPAKAERFDKGLLSLIRRAEFCLFCVVVDKQANLDRYGAHSPEQYAYALASLVVRYTGWLHYIVGGVGDVMVEARYRKADRDLAQAYRDIWQNGTTNYPGPRPLRGETLRPYLTTRELKLKEKRFNIAGLQLADLLTYCCKVDTLWLFRRPAPRLGPYSTQVLGAVQRKYNCRVSDGDAKGYGKILISPK